MAAASEGDLARRETSSGDGVMRLMTPLATTSRDRLSGSSTIATLQRYSTSLFSLTLVLERRNRWMPSVVAGLSFASITGVASLSAAIVSSNRALAVLDWNQKREG